MNAMNAINAINDQKNNATTCNQQPNGGGKVTPAHYEELEELQLESVAGGTLKPPRYETPDPVCVNGVWYGLEERIAEATGPLSRGLEIWEERERRARERYGLKEEEKEERNVGINTLPGEGDYSLVPGNGLMV